MCTFSAVTMCSGKRNMYKWKRNRFFITLVAKLIPWDCDYVRFVWTMSVSTHAHDFARRIEDLSNLFPFRLAKRYNLKQRTFEAGMELGGNGYISIGSVHRLILLYATIGKTNRTGEYGFFNRRIPRANKKQYKTEPITNHQFGVVKTDRMPLYHSVYSEIRNEYIQIKCMHGPIWFPHSRPINFTFACYCSATELKRNNKKCTSHSYAIGLVFIIMHVRSIYYIMLTGTAPNCLYIFLTIIYSA